MDRWRTSTRLLLFWLAVLPVVTAPIVLGSGGRPGASSGPALVVLGVAWLIVLAAIVVSWFRTRPRAPVVLVSAVSPMPASPGFAAGAVDSNDLGTAATAPRSWTAWATLGAGSEPAESRVQGRWRRALRVAVLSMLLYLSIQVVLDLLLPRSLTGSDSPAAIVVLAISFSIVGRRSGLSGAIEWGRATITLIVVTLVALLALGALILALS